MGPCQANQNTTEHVWPSTEKLCFGIFGKMTFGLSGPEGIPTKSLSNAGGYHVNLQLN